MAGRCGGKRRGPDDGPPCRDRVTRPRAAIGRACLRGAGRCAVGKRAWQAITGRCGSSAGAWNATTRPCIVDTRPCDAITIAKARITRACDSSFGYRDRETTGLARITRPCIDETASWITITRACIAITRACCSIMGARITLPRPCDRSARRCDGGSPQAQACRPFGVRACGRTYNKYKKRVWWQS